MKFYKILIISFFLTSLAYSDLREEFPSYSYVLTEFGIDDEFIDNPIFKRFIEKNKDRYRKHFIRAAKRGGLIIPTLKEMMYQRNISPVFLYISMIESAFKPKATSRTGAGGLWQFVVLTAGDLNLKITKDVDERYDPLRATNAAVKYLYQINSDLDSWYLTTMAYNCGKGCVKRSITKARTRDLGALINPRNNFIKAETRKYIQKILLMAMIGENYLFKDDDILGKMMYAMSTDKITPVKVKSGETLSNLANVLNMNKKFLVKINPHLKKGHAPYRNGYSINIPTSRVAMFNERYRNNNEFRYAQNDSRYKSYRVKRDDSLLSIAREHQLLVADIRKANKSMLRELYIGQKIKLPINNRYARR